MPPSIALILWFILLLFLLYFDPAKVAGTSPALWVPVIWMFILGTRLPSQWLGGQVGQVAAALEEGNPLDRTVYLVLILLAIGILIARSFNWSSFFARNVALLAFLGFALLSVCWSDFPFVAFKRWFRDLGSYLVILLALSDSEPLEAVRTVLRRLCYLLIPLSILLVKYYPEIGRQYDYWQGTAMYVGAATSKNMLGVLCLVSGMFFFWDTVTRLSDRHQPQTRRIILVNGAFLAMTLWLLNLSNSATSRVCLAIGCLVVAAAHSKWFRQHPRVLKTLIPVGVGLYLGLAFGFGVDINAVIAESVGRDPTLTDRTKIWAFLLSMHTNPLFGTGYQSFWMGPRLQWFWQNAGLGHINEAHNGYLEVYLNLGIIGLFLLGVFLIASYRTICRRLEPLSKVGSLSLAVWTVLVFYNVTEAAFQGGLLWMMLLSGVLVVSGRSESRVHNVAAFQNARSAEPLSSFPLETTGQWW